MESHNKEIVFSLAKTYQFLLVLVLCLLFVTSFLLLLVGRLPNFTNLFDLFVLSSVVFFKTNRKQIVLASLLLLYVTYHVFYVLNFYTVAHLRDLALSLKFVIYFIILLLISRRMIISVESYKKVVELLLVLFIVKYIITRIFGDSRPPLFTENNFELCALSVLYLAYVFLGGASKFKFVLISFIIIISGSRSAVLGLVILYVYQFNPFSGMSFVQIVKMLFLIIIAALATLIMLSRMGSSGLESIDRFVFMLVFIDNVSVWGIKELLIGNQPLTPLLPESCSQLNFYKDLFSRVDGKVCYPLILHSFWLRVVLEHGLVVVPFIYIMLSTILKTKGFDNRFCFYCFSLVAVNGLSVSAFSSSVVILSLVVLALLEPVKELKGYFSIGKVN